MYANQTEETILKPIGSLAQAIEALPWNNFVQLMVNLSKREQKEQEAWDKSNVTIGKND